MRAVSLSRLPCEAPRRDSAPAGGSLFSAGPEKSNQKRGPEHQPFEWLAAATRLLHRLWPENTNRTTSSVASLRFKHAESLRLDPVGSSVGVLVPRAVAVNLQPKRAGQMAGVQALCFGDFHLGPQMKVTRVPGRDPAGCTAGRSCPARQQKPGGHT